MKGTFRDLTGQVFQYITVIRRACTSSYRNKCKCVKWLCRCVCGKEWVLERPYRYKSCGCKTKKRPWDPRILQKPKGKHTPEYSAWSSAKARCYNKQNPAYFWYGARGIKVCDRWLEKNGFFNFLEDMGKRPSSKHSLDRYPNNNGDYEPSNCRWTTQKEQIANQRKRAAIDNFTDEEIMKEFIRRGFDSTTIRGGFFSTNVVATCT